MTLRHVQPDAAALKRQTNETFLSAARPKRAARMAFNGIVLAACAFIAGCNGGNGLKTLPPVTPAQSSAVASHVAATVYYVELHPADAPDLAMLRKLHDQWHAGGIRIDYLGNNAFYDGLVANARAVGLQLIFVTPYTTASQSVSNYAQAAGAAAARYAGDGITWEIYNEPDLLLAKNLGVGLGGYIALAKATAIAIRAADPAATILTGGTSGIDVPHFPFAIAAAKALAPYVNGVSIHPYGVDYTSFGSAVVDVGLATNLPVYVTEWGNNNGQGLAQAMQAVKGLTAVFCAYEYTEQAAEIAAGDQDWGLLDSGAWQTFAAAAQ